MYSEKELTLEELELELDSISFKNLELNIVSDSSTKDSLKIKSEKNTTKPVKKEKNTERKQNDVKVEVSNNIVNWMYPLYRVEDTLTINEDDLQEYKYIQIKDPDGGGSGQFMCFAKDCLLINKDTGERIWKASDNCLSKKYIVSSVSEFIKTNLKNINIIGDTIIHHEPFMYSKQMNTDIIIRYLKMDDLRKIYSSILNNEKLDISNIRTKVAIKVINSYNAYITMRMEFILVNKFNINGQTYKFYDYFTLINRNLTIANLISKTLSIKSMLENVQKWMDEDVIMLKSYSTELDIIVTELCRKIDSKKCRDMFLSYNEMVRPKNLYEVMMILSLSLNKYYDIDIYEQTYFYLKKLTKNKVFKN